MALSNVTNFPVGGLAPAVSRLTQGILDTARFIVLLLDRDGGILYYNPYMECLGDRPLSGTVGGNWFDLFIDPAERPRAERQFRRALQGMPARGDIESLLCRAGERRYIEWYSSRLLTERGELQALLCIGHDVTQRLDAERELRSQREQTQLLVAQRTRELEHLQQHLSRELRRQQDLAAELAAQGESFRALAYVSPVGILRADPQGRVIYANRRWSDISGLDVSDTLADGWRSAVHPDDRERVTEAWHRVVAMPDDWHEEFRLQRPNGEVRWVECRAVPERDAEGRVKGFAGTVTDITERRHAEQALQESEHLFRSFFEYSNIGLAIIDPRGHWMRVNRELCDMLGYAEADLLGSAWDTPTHPDDMADDRVRFTSLLRGDIPRYEQDKRFLRRDGQTLHTHLTLAGHSRTPGQVDFVIVSVQDITEQRRMQAELQRLALRDPLTGVYNRLELSRRLQEEVARARRYDRPVAAFMLDVDHFKRINDNHGHAAGDAALTLLVEVLDGALRRSDYIARFGGEEFVVVLPETDAAEAVELAERLRTRVERTPLGLPDGHRLSLTASIGVAAFPQHADDWEQLIQVADRAMYRAKEGGRNRVENAG